MIIQELFLGWLVTSGNDNEDRDGRVCDPEFCSETFIIGGNEIGETVPCCRVVVVID